MKATLAALLVVGALLSTANQAECGLKRSQSSDHIENAKEFYKKGNYQQALQQYTIAYKIKGDFHLLFYIARTHTRLRNYQQAVIFYTKYLQKGNKSISPNKHIAVEKEIEKLRAMAAYNPSSANSGNRSLQKAAAYLQQGYKYRAQQRYALARKAFVEAYRLNPEYKTLYAQATCEARLNLFEDAKNTYTRFLAEGGAAIPPYTQKEVRGEIARLSEAAERNSRKKESMAFIREARALYSNGMFVESAAKLDEAYKAYPDVEYLYEIGRTAIQTEDYKKSIEAFTKYLEIAGARLAPSKKGEVKREIDRLNKIVKDQEVREQSEKLMELGHKHFKQQQYKKAANYFEKAYQTYPEHKYLYSLGNAQAAYNQYTSAILSYERYLKEGRSDISKKKRRKIRAEIDRLHGEAKHKDAKQRAFKCVQKGLGYYKKKDYRNALDQFAEAYRLTSDYRILLKIAESSAGAEEYKTSISAYSRYIEDGGENITPSEKTEVEKAIKKLTDKQELSRRKQKALGHYNSAKFLIENKKYSKAFDEYKAAYNLYPSYRILYSMAKTKHILKQYRGAIDLYKEYLDKGGEKIGVTKRKKIQEIIFDLTQSIRQETTREMAMAHYDAGIGLKKKKRYKSAIKELDKAYDLVGNYKILYHIAQAETAQKKPRKAIEAYKRYLEEGGKSVSISRRAEVQKEIKRLYRVSKN